MPGQVYTASFAAIAVTAVSDLLEISAPSDAVVRIISASCGQTSDYGDSEAEGLSLSWTRYASAGTGGTAVTPRPHSLGVTASSTVTRNRTGQGTTPTEVLQEAFNAQVGWFYRPTPEEQIVIPPSGILTLELTKAPADSIDVTVSVTFEEVGNQ
jgi:hypothetical protein